MLLRIESLSKYFGSVPAADAVDLEVAEGEALGIVGPNGAGKTTLFNLIAGVVPPDAGRILLDGRDVTDAPPQKRCIAGIGRSFQIPAPFEGLSVFENLLVAATHGQRRREADCIETCGSILERTGLLALANRQSGSLTLLERKRLEMARALATGPRLLLLDEIAGGLTEAECGALVETINDLRADKVTIVWIEHVVHALLAVVNRLVVLDFGRKIAEGRPREVMESRAVREIYLGIET